MSIFGSKNALSIDFGAYEMKIVEGKYSKKGIAIDKSFSIDLPSGLYKDGIIQDMDQFVYLLKQGLSDNKVVLGDTYGVINSSDVIVREINIPKVDDNQINSIIQYQLDDFLPVNPEEYVVNFLKIGTVMDEGVEKIQVMLFGVPKVIIECHFNLLQNVGLKPMVLDYSGNSIRKLLMSGMRINDSIDITGNIATIDLGCNTSSITIVNGDTIKLSRLSEMGSLPLIESLKQFFPNLSDKDLEERVRNFSDINKDYNPNTEDYKLAEGIKTYINGTISSVEMIFRFFNSREIGNTVDLIVLLGGMSNIDGIDKMFAEFFAKPTLRLDSIDGLKFNGDLFRYANAIGGLIRIDEVR